MIIINIVGNFVSVVMKCWIDNFQINPWFSHYYYLCIPKLIATFNSFFIYIPAKFNCLADVFFLV